MLSPTQAIFTGAAHIAGTNAIATKYAIARSENRLFMGSILFVPFSFFKHFCIYVHISKIIPRRSFRDLEIQGRLEEESWPPDFQRWDIPRMEPETAGSDAHHL
ncbi:MAG: hypothetical protein LIO63_04365 [Akkermansia sp.]|nr:hypothetical protein [Akkermansia sp.]